MFINIDNKKKYINIDIKIASVKKAIIYSSKKTTVLCNALAVGLIEVLEINERKDYGEPNIRRLTDWQDIDLFGLTKYKPAKLDNDSTGRFFPMHWKGIRKAILKQILSDLEKEKMALDEDWSTFP